MQQAIGDPGLVGIGEGRRVIEGQVGNWQAVTIYAIGPGRPGQTGEAVVIFGGEDQADRETGGNGEQDRQGDQ